MLTAMKKPRIPSKSIPWLVAIDEHVRSCNIRGRSDRFRDIAADVLDGWALKEELRPLIKRHLLKVVKHGFDDSMGRDPLRDSDPHLCGTSWSVNPTKRLIRALWPDRLVRKGAAR